MFLLTAYSDFPLSLDRVRQVFVEHHLLASNLVNLALYYLQLFHINTFAHYLLQIYEIASKDANIFFHTL